MQNAQTIHGLEIARNLTVVNARLPIDDFTSELREDGRTNPKGLRKLVYPGAPIAAGKDYTIRRGDPVVRKRERPFGVDQQPSVRACLNNVRVETKETNPTHEELVNQFWKEHALVGVSRKDVVVDMGAQGTTAPNKDEPVVVLEGKFTVTHTGRNEIAAGEAVEVYCPEPDRITPSAYNAMGSVKLGRSRIPQGYRTFDASSDARSYVADSALYKRAFLDFMRVLTGKTEAELKLGDAHAMYDIFDGFMNNAMTSTVDAFKYVGGVAQQSAPAGYRFDVMVHPFAQVALSAGDAHDAVVKEKVHKLDRGLHVKGLVDLVLKTYGASLNDKARFPDVSNDGAVRTTATNTLEYIHRGNATDKKMNNLVHMLWLAQPNYKSDHNLGKNAAFIRIVEDLTNIDKKGEHDIDSVSGTVIKYKS